MAPRQQWWSGTTGRVLSVIERHEPVVVQDDKRLEKEQGPSLGWWVIVDTVGMPPIAVGFGRERPDLKIGDVLRMGWEKVQ